MISIVLGNEPPDQIHVANSVHAAAPVGTTQAAMDARPYRVSASELRKAVVPSNGINIPRSHKRFMLIGPGRS